jgi:hypothetical protein
VITGRKIGTGIKNESGPSFREKSLNNSTSRNLPKKHPAERRRFSKAPSAPKVKILSIQ